jgi:hypothetical protein
VMPSLHHGSDFVWYVSGVCERVWVRGLVHSRRSEPRSRLPGGVGALWQDLSLVQSGLGT